MERKIRYLCIQYKVALFMCTVYGGISCVLGIWWYLYVQHMEVSIIFSYVQCMDIFFYSGHSFIFLMQISKSPAQTQLHDKILAPCSHHQKEPSSSLHTVLSLSSMYKQYAVSSCAPSSGEYRQLELYPLTLCLCRQLGALCITHKKQHNVKRKFHVKPGILIQGHALLVRRSISQIE